MTPEHPGRVQTGSASIQHPGYWWYRARALLLEVALRDYLGTPQRMLDVGSADGPSVSWMRGNHWRTAIDVDPRGLKPGEGVCASAMALPFPDETFDVVGAFDVIEHIDEDELALASIRDAARPGGGVILTVPQHRWLWSAHDEYGHHKRRYTRRELKAKLGRAGLELLRATSFVSIPLPAMYLSRLRNRGPVESFDPAAEFRIPRALNAALERILGLELALIRRGISLPAGGTLLAIARRR